MKIIFCTSMFTDVEKDIKISRKPNPISGHKFQENLLKGLIDNIPDTKVLNIPRIRHYPDYPKILFRKSDFIFQQEAQGINIGFLNLPGINWLTIMASFYHQLKKELLSLHDKPCILLIFNTNLVQSIIVQQLQKHYKDIILCDVVTDLYGKYGLHIGHGIKGKLIDCLDNQKNLLASHFDTYVLLSKYMREPLGIEDKPYVIVEGFSLVLMGNTSSKIDSNQKTIFYAGAVREEYGIEHLLKAFSLIKSENYQLVIAGTGNAEALVCTYARKDPRIRYLGVITPKEVAMQQQNATVLVSPRLPDYEYVKYSFPSKTMECLSSGKPYIAHRLPCEPPEYSQYIQYPDSESDESLKNKIIEICELSQEERDIIGQRAQQFIINEKNPSKMCQRIIKMWESLVEGKIISKN